MTNASALPHRPRPHRRRTTGDAAILNFDFMLGANPMGMSWTTRLSYVATDIQHEISQKDGIHDPPGITIYGITGGGYIMTAGNRLEVAQRQRPRIRRVQFAQFPGAAGLPPLNGPMQIHHPEDHQLHHLLRRHARDPDPPRPLRQPRAPRPAEVLYGRWYSHNPPQAGIADILCPRQSKPTLKFPTPYQSHLERMWHRRSRLCSTAQSVDSRRLSTAPQRKDRDTRGKQATRPKRPSLFLLHHPELVHGPRGNAYRSAQRTIPTQNRKHARTRALGT